MNWQGMIRTAWVGAATAACNMAAAAAPSGANGSESGLTAVGKAIGMVIFGYLALRFANRKRDEDEAQASSRRSKRIYFGLAIVVVLLVVLVSRP